MNSILDTLLEEEYDGSEEINQEQIIIPRRCAVCKAATVCTVLPTFMGLSKLGICVEIQECPYSTVIKKDE